jgi:hypothetical protein
MEATAFFALGVGVWFGGSCASLGPLELGPGPCTGIHGVGSPGYFDLRLIDPKNLDPLIRRITTEEILSVFLRIEAVLPLRIEAVLPLRIEVVLPLHIERTLVLVPLQVLNRCVVCVELANCFAVFWIGPRLDHFVQVVNHVERKLLG